MKKRSDDFEKWVNGKEEISEAKKTVAMLFVDTLRPLENGDGGSIRALIESHVALAPMMLEVYLRDNTKGVADAIDAHTTACKDSTEQSPLGKGGLTIAAVKAGGWPLAFIILGTQYHEEIKALFTYWCS